VLALRLGSLGRATAVGAIERDTARDGSFRIAIAPFKQASDDRDDKGSHNQNADEENSNSEHADHFTFSFFQTPICFDPLQALLQLLAARLAGFPTDSRFPAAVEALQPGVLNVDGAKSEPDCKQDRAADNRDEGDGTEHFFEHRDESKHKKCCL